MHFLEHVIALVVGYTVPVIEILGGLVVVIGVIRTVAQLVRASFRPESTLFEGIGGSSGKARTSSSSASRVVRRLRTQKAPWPHAQLRLRCSCTAW